MCGLVAYAGAARNAVQNSAACLPRVKSFLTAVPHCDGRPDLISASLATARALPLRSLETRMLDVAAASPVRLGARLTPILVAVTTSLFLGACAGGPGVLSDLSTGPSLGHSAPSRAADAGAAPQTELQKATAYWGKKVAENPQDARAAVSYAKNLKAAGNKRDAMQVLQQAHSANPNDRELNSEYGRLALEHDQLTLAEKLLEHADNPAQPDWRVVSARGTVLAKQGKHGEAITMYERALEISPGQPSVMNNLAMTHAMTGQASKAEGLLRQASVKGDTDPRVQQNLALVLGLNGKHDEAKVMGADNLPPDTSSHNADVVRQMVQSSEPVEIAPAPEALARPSPVAAKAANAKAAKLATASVATPAVPAAAKGKGKAKAVAAEPEVDAAEMVRRLADGDAGAAKKR
jgi:Flp pilus assembly protein TadD